MTAPAPLTPEVRPAPAAAAEGARVTLARDLADLLMELSLALGHQSAYPPGHPMLLAAAERLTHTLAVVLDGRGTLTLGIARRQLVIDGVATDPRNAMLGNLAQRLHRHRVAAVKFERGITGSEAAAMLRALSTDPRRDGPVGLLPEEQRRWAHVQFYPARYAKLELRDAAEGEADESEGVRLWLDLTRAALPTDGEAGTAGSNHPVVLAAAINRHGRDSSYDETVIRYLLQVADEVAVGESVEQAWLRRRLSRLIAALDPKALRRLLEVCGGSSSRRKFVLDASQTLAADAVVKLVQAAAVTSERTISDNLMLLMGKFAQHSESASPETAAAAESALRENVERLVSDWELEDPNPEAYSSVLHHMVRAGPREGPGIEFTLEPEQIVQIGLELDETGRRVHAAVERLIAEGRARVLSELLEQAPHPGGASEQIWRLVSPHLLRSELEAQPPDFARVESLALRLGAAAADPLLDALTKADERSVRSRLMRILQAVGAPVGPPAVARLQGSPWFVQRNILMLLSKLGSWPEGFSPNDYIGHSDPRVRREAYRMLFDDPATRDFAIEAGLGDSDAAVLDLSLRAATTACPPSAIPRLERILRDPSANPESRVLALKVLVGSRVPDAAARLLAVATQRRWWGRISLASKSPVLLASLAALAEGWSADAQVAPVLTLATRHRDPEIRAAVGAWQSR